MNYTLRSLLLATSAVAVIAAGYTLAWDRLTGKYGQIPPLALVLDAGMMCPFWAPFLAVAYAFGRRRIVWSTVAAIALLEVVAIGIQVAAMQWIY